MILERLDLENIRSWKSSSITFPEGITLFEGEIGSGKSSLLMGIEFALFGYGKAESLLSKKAHAGSATLFFSVDGKKYEVRRALERRKGKAGQNSKETYIVEDGEKVPLSASELKQRVLQILRFNENPRPSANSRIYRYAVFTPQEEMKVILADDKSRFEAIRRAFGVEDYACAVTNSALISSRIRDAARVLAERFRGLEEARARLKEAEEAAASNAAKIEKMEAGEKAARRKHDTARRELDAASDRCNERARRAADRDNAAGRAADCDRDVQRHEEEAARSDKEAARGREELERIETSPPSEIPSAEIGSRMADMEKAQSAMEKARARYEECRRIAKDGSPPDDAVGSTERAGKAAAGIEKMRKEISAARSEIDGLLRDATKKRTRADTLRDELGTIEELGNVCPTCKQPIEEEYTARMRSDRSAQIDRLDKEAAEIDGRINAGRGKIREMDRQVTEMTEEVKECEVLASRLKAHKKAVGDMEDAKGTADEAVARYSEAAISYGLGDDPVAELRRARDKMAEYERGRARASGLEDATRAHAAAAESHRAEAERLRKEADSARSEAAEMEGKLAALGGADEEKRSAEVAEEESRLEIERISSELGSVRQALVDARRRIKECGEAITDGERWRAKHDRLGDHAWWLDGYFKKSAETIEQQVLVSTRQEFDARYREIYSALIDDPSKESRIDEDFGPLVSQDGIEQDLEYMSGGEKSSIALAYRLTINTMLRRSIDTLRSNLLILDEPTDGFSKTQLAKVRGVLDGLKSQQVILVSHDPELEAYADHVFRVSKEGGASSVAKVEQAVP